MFFVSQSSLVDSYTPTVVLNGGNDEGWHTETVRRCEFEFGGECVLGVLWDCDGSVSYCCNRVNYKKKKKNNRLEVLKREDLRLTEIELSIEKLAKNHRVQPPPSNYFFIQRSKVVSIKTNKLSIFLKKEVKVFLFIIKTLFSYHFFNQI